MIYIVIIILLLYFGRQEKLYTLVKKKRFLCIFSLIFILLIGFRCIQTGQDTDMYGVIYSNLNRFNSYSSFMLDSDFENSIEFGYASWQWLIHLFFDYRGFLILQAVLMIVPFSYVVFKWSDDCRISFVLYILLGYFTWNMCAARQAPAVSLTFLAYYFYCSKMYKKALFSYLVAISFHTTALIFLPFVFGLQIIKKDQILIISLIVTKLIGGVLIPIVLPYLRVDYSGDVQKGSVGQLTYFGFIALLFLMLYIKKQKRIELPDSFYMFSYMMILWPLVDTISAGFRITFYFMIYLCLAIPSIMKALKLQKQRSLLMVYKIFCIGILSVYFYNMHYGNLGRHVYPYYSMFEYSDNCAKIIYKD